MACKTFVGAPKSYAAKMLAVMSTKFNVRGKSKLTGERGGCEILHDRGSNDVSGDLPPAKIL